MILELNEAITINDLHEFANWARDDNSPRLGAKSAWSVVEKGNVAKTSKRAYNMTDEKAEKIDKGICALTNHDLGLSALLSGYYIDRKTHRELAKCHDCSRTVISKDLAMATGYVIGVANNI